MKLTESTNLLANETSLYLKQHSGNPVNWNPWSIDILKRAADENKPLIISIGYSSCHWCHVMEKEVFSDKALASIMNENFICVKIDREERPDIDQYYMKALNVISGSGGWPLNCFALPDGRAFYGGTYFSSADWKRILDKVSYDYKNNYDQLVRSADSIENGVREMVMHFVTDAVNEFDEATIISGFNNWKLFFDGINGGINFAPKFPMPSNYKFLLKYCYYTKDPSALSHLTLTLEKMYAGGIFDHIGGGFARYSTDKEWKVPHFEKMLYDNAQLASIYSQAYQYTDNIVFKETVERLLNFIINEMTSPNGGFYSSFDADSEGEEGKFYLWTKAEIVSLLGKNADVFCDYFNVTEDGNWNSSNVLHTTEKLSDISKKYSLSEQSVSKIINSGITAMYEKRLERKRPERDDKKITSWNAMMITGFLDAYRAIGNCVYLEWAIANAEFIEERVLNDNNRLYRVFSNRFAKIDGFLDDYSFTAEAFLQLYQITFDNKWLKIAKALIDSAIADFYSEKQGLFRYSASSNELNGTVFYETDDNVIPSSNSSMANALFALGNIIKSDYYINIAKRMLSMVYSNITGNMQYFSNWAYLALSFVNAPNTVHISGKNTFADRMALLKKYNPGLYITNCNSESDYSDKSSSDEKVFQCCSGKKCHAPVGNVAQVEKQING